MNKSKSKYYNTACLMDEAFILLLEEKDYEYITVKEVCDKAGVNRSTFYLHYESMADLLEESIQFVLKNFYLHMQSAKAEFCIDSISNLSLDDLYLIKLKYLIPYLQYIQENKRIFHILLQNIKVFKWDNTFDFMFQKIFSPILERYEQPENVRPYLVSFYIKGLMGIITLWLQNDCKESVEEIAEIIQKCVKGGSYEG